MLYRESILDKSSKHLVTADITCFLYTAILKSSFVIADVIATCYPELWTLSANQNPAQTNLRRHRIDYFPLTPFGLPTIPAILSCGSYKQCQFVLKNILSSRAYPSKTSGLRTSKQVEHSEDDGVPPWMRCPLSSEEFNILVDGNISYRDDRQALWNVIGEQVALGHSTSVEHLKIAISQGDADALEQMLSRGWNSNGHLGTYFSPPLQFVYALSKRESGFMNAMNWLYRDLPQDEWIDSATHATVYMAYRKQRKMFSDKEITARTERCRKTLIEHGARVPWIVTYLSTFRQTLLVWACIICALTYFIVLPPCLVYLTTNVWDDMSTGQKFGFAYLWAALSFFFPFGFLMLTWGQIVDPDEIFGVSWFSVLFLIINDFTLPISIIRLNWKPFLSCNKVLEDQSMPPGCADYSFLLPLVIAAVELLIVVPLYRML